MKKPLDLIVFGATSFVGQILCRYLSDTFNGKGQEALVWAIAGRSRPKLEKVKDETGIKDLRILIADSDDKDSLDALCAEARVIASTVGPYAFYGENLVRACCESGTDYCDLTGESLWIHPMLKRYESMAKKTGARIVHACGFDSVPSDIGVYFTQQLAKKKFGNYCNQIKMRVKAIRGGASGGTVASVINHAEEVVKSPSLLKNLANPYLICPEQDCANARQSTNNLPAQDPDFNRWTAPFIMAAINTQIVFRSHALSGHPYGRDFTYDEAMLTGKGAKGMLKSGAIVGGLSTFLSLVALPPSRWLLKKTILPNPGQGPSPEAQQNGFYDIRFAGKTPEGQTIRTHFIGRGDPGYCSTSKILGQSAACLALDMHENGLKIEGEGGFWTTATLLGDHLVSRLQTFACIEIDEDSID
ncbi:saccharopine dehydrogenase family protein [Veronia pacifica]|uniref:Saccharopine dehydrogenase n=1 Tax=Veronia pacifica TaxID=1080227 RepID=A0A1C3EC43_9GAMM|nr:saccharopine dehydrogenase NADP-binding domain-containing protein [Veronia pacifica]ODA30827.1 saccharopine dehydrogenase [Veronia pacifica]